MSEHHPTRLLLAIVREDWNEAERLVAIAAPDPESFAKACVGADIHPWVHSLVIRNRRESLLGEAVIERLGRMRDKLRQDNLLLFARAERALDALAAAGVTPVALKGLDLIHRLYERFDERTMDDIDLLVRQSELVPALDALRKAGWVTPEESRTTHYIRSSHHLPLSEPGPLGVELELHWNLAQEDRYRIDPAGLFDRAATVDVGGRATRRLCDADLVGHLLVHHLSHYFDRRLKWVVDLQRITSQDGFDWEAVVARVREWGAGVASGISLIHMDKLMPGLIPGRVLRSLPVSTWRRALAAPLRSAHPLELYRGTRRRSVQLYLAALLLERPTMLPRWLVHRQTRDRRRGANPLDRRPETTSIPDSEANARKETS